MSVSCLRYQPYLLGNLVQSLGVLSKGLVFVPVTSSPLLLSLHLNFHWSVNSVAQYSQVSLMALMVVELSKDIRSISLRSSWYSLLLHLEWHCSCRDQSEIPISVNTPYNPGEREELSHSNSGYLVRTWTDDWKRPRLGQSIKSIWQHICYITNCQCWEILTRCYFIRREKTKSKVVRSGPIFSLSHCPVQSPAMWLRT